VTGLAVIPSIGANEGIGQDAVVTAGGLRRLDPSAAPTTFGVDIGSGGSTETVLPAPGLLLRSE